MNKKVLNKTFLQEFSIFCTILIGIDLFTEKRQSNTPPYFVGFIRNRPLKNFRKPSEKTSIIRYRHKDRNSKFFNFIFSIFSISSSQRVKNSIHVNALSNSKSLKHTLQNLLRIWPRCWHLPIGRKSQNFSLNLNSYSGYISREVSTGTWVQTLYCNFRC